MSSRDGPDRQNDRPIRRGGAKAMGTAERALVRRWRLFLRVEGFTDEQAARLIVTKLLYLRRSLRG